MNALEDRIFTCSNDSDFKSLALEVFSYQREHCLPYRDYINYLNWPEPKELDQIPFLPISFFKSHAICDQQHSAMLEFKSSGTGGDRSTHYVAKPAMYERSFNPIYREYIGHPEEQVILALLPNYIEQGASSLVYMVDHLIKATHNELSAFLLSDPEKLIEHYTKGIASGKQVVIFGVSYALLDLAELRPNLRQAIIIETGGMKGRRKELTKAELHSFLKEGFNHPQIASEYGMTELLSQSYSKKDGSFDTCPWMKILIRETNDPFSYVEDGKTGGINVIDLANLYSCSFIATQDLGKKTGNSFEIMGRFDHSDLRGCNLLVQ